MNKKVHFDSGLNDDDDNDDTKTPSVVTKNSKFEHSSSIEGVPSSYETRSYHIEIPVTTHSPLFFSRNGANDRDLPLSLSPGGLSRRRQATPFEESSEQSESSPALRRRQLLTPELENPKYVLNICTTDSALEESIENIRSFSPNSAGQSTDLENTDKIIDDVNDEVQPRQYSYNFPFFTLIIMFINWVFFIWGIVWIIGWEEAGLSMSGPVSPPQSIFPFITVNYWPSCTSARGNSWRLMTAQFTHAGLMHIGGNTVVGILYGLLLEGTHQYHSFITIVVYEMACIFGCLGHSYLWPFEGIIGCSTGIYGLIGSVISHTILNRDTLDRRVYYFIVVTLVIQGTYDLVTYFNAYNPDIAYAGHCTGFFTGIFLGLTCGLMKKQVWKRVLGLLGFVAFLVLTISLIVHYVDTWPPSRLAYNPTFHDYDRTSCCGELYSVTNRTFTLEQARENFGCRNDKIFEWHKQ